VNAGLLAIGEPEIAAFDTARDDIVQEMLIQEANNAVREVLSLGHFRWGLHRSTFLTVDDITEEYVAVTNGSATVTSVDEDGADATNFGDVTTDMFIRVGVDLESYKITDVDVVSTPNTLTIEQAYRGTTDTDTTYVIFQDTYDITTSNVDEIKLLQYGQGRVYIQAGLGDTIIEQVKLETIYREAGGDIHRDTSGKPALFAVISNDADEYPRIVLWPYPKDVYLMEFWYLLNFDENETAATAMFGADAPLVAYDAVEYRVCRRACQHDQDWTGFEAWDRQHKQALSQIVARENRGRIDNQMSVETFRRESWRGIRGQSAIAYDTQSAVRHW